MNTDLFLIGELGQTRNQMQDYIFRSDSDEQLVNVQRNSLEAIMMEGQTDEQLFGAAT
jgi:hypothetical protein